MLLVGWAGAPVIRAQDYEGMRIAAIEFEPLRQPLPDTEIAGLIGLRVGEPLWRRLAVGHRTALRDLALHRHRGGRPPGRRRRGQFITEMSWFVGRVSVENVPEPPNSAHLENATKLELHSTATSAWRSPSATCELRCAMPAHEAKVQPRVERVEETGETNITFPVAAGPRARFSEPVITGDPGRPAEKVISALHWKRFWMLPGWSPMTESRLQQGLERIRNSYRKRGLLMAKVELESMEYDSGSDTVKPTIRVTAGPKIRVEVTGAKVSQGRLKSLVPVYQEQSVDGSLLMEGRRNLAEHFQAQATSMQK
jgi:hypothetical protein